MIEYCPKCEGYSLKKVFDYKYDIIYYSCFKCGYVKFLDDGLGILRIRFNKKETTYSNTCKICGQQFVSSSPNKKICEKCINVKQRG